MRGCPAISYGWGRGHIRVEQPGVSPLRPRRRSRARLPSSALRFAARSSRAERRRRRSRPGNPPLPFVLAAANAALTLRRTAPGGSCPAAAPSRRRSPRLCRIPLPPRLAHTASRSPSTTARTPRDAGGARGACTRRRVGDVLPRRRAGRALPGGGRGDRGRRPRDRAPRLPAPLLLRRGAAALRADLDAGARVIATATGHRADALPPALRRLQRPGAADRARARLAAAAVVALGPRLGPQSDPRVDRRARHADTQRPATSCCCTTPTTTARRTPGAGRLRRLPAISTPSPRVGEPLVSASHST